MVLTPGFAHSRHLLRVNNNNQTRQKVNTASKKDFGKEVRSRMWERYPRQGEWHEQWLKRRNVRDLHRRSWWFGFGWNKICDGKLRH